MSFKEGFPGNKYVGGCDQHATSLQGFSQLVRQWVSRLLKSVPPLKSPYVHVSCCNILTSHEPGILENSNHNSGASSLQLLDWNFYEIDREI